MLSWNSDTAAVQGRAFIRTMMMTESCTVFGLSLVCLHFYYASLGLERASVGHVEEVRYRKRKII